MTKPIFIICGKSGVGKTTLINDLCQRNNLRTAESYTTRPKRNNMDRSHIFVTKKEFELIPDKFLQFTFSGYEYCITNSQLEASDILGLSPNAYKELHNKKNLLSRSVYLIYITIEDNIRYERMLHRNNKTEWIINRMKTEEKYFTDIEDYANKIVCNDNVERCLNEIERFIYDRD